MENRRGGEIVGAVVVFFVLLFVFTKFIGPIPFSVNNINTTNETPFQAQGSGKASAPPDTAVINLGITQTGQTVLETQKKTNEVSEKIIDSLKKLGVDGDKIKTTNYSVNPNYSFTEENQRITGYTITQNFEVKVPIDKANDVVDSATSSGANVVGNISFTLDDEKELELKNKARKEAVKNAKASAQGLANASGIKLGKIINVTENFGNIFPQPVMLDAKVSQGGEEPARTNITPGESNVEVNVVLTYETF